ncbi:hypothetical protein Mapa_014676 [Marchantia paleacea]|nr:hypothetical protein Mapa_014676 [Marchantia paleacea]
MVVVVLSYNVANVGSSYKSPSKSVHGCCLSNTGSHYVQFILSPKMTETQSYFALSIPCQMHGKVSNQCSSRRENSLARFPERILDPLTRPSLCEDRCEHRGSFPRRSARSSAVIHSRGFPLCRSSSGATSLGHDHGIALSNSRQQLHLGQHQARTSDDPLGLRRHFLLLEREARGSRRRHSSFHVVSAITIPQNFPHIRRPVEFRLQFRRKPGIPSGAPQNHATNVAIFARTRARARTRIRRPLVQREPLGLDVLGLPPRRQWHALLLHRPSRRIAHHVQNL